MNFAELKALRSEIWPQGEAPELVIPHNKSFISALVDIQRKVECQQVNNTEIYQFCSTMFQCGMTVMNAPRGKINRVSTYAKLDEDCAEDADSPVNWCDEVQYNFMDYGVLVKLLDKTLKCRCNTTFASLLNLDFPTCHKILGDAYPAPDDSDYEGYDALPMGFHYAQSSTDSTKKRARCGVYSIHQGRIYIAPWIQSTEIVVVEWDGIKRVWSNEDLVCDDHEFLEAVKLYVQAEHARDWDENIGKYELAKDAYDKAVAAMIIDCDDENREHVRRASKARMSQATLSDQEEVCPTTTTSSTTTEASSEDCLAQLVYYTSGTPDDPPNVNCPAQAADPNGVLPTRVWSIEDQQWN